MEQIKYLDILIKTYIIVGTIQCRLTVYRNYKLEHCLTQSEYRLDEGIYYTYSPVGLQMCARECASRNMCLAFNFNFSNLTCELIAKTSALVMGIPKENPLYVFVNISTCTQEYSVCSTIACPDNTKCVILKTGSPVCIQSGCDPPASVIRTDISPVSAVVTNVAAYTCKDQCQLFGNPTVTCKANSNWTSSTLQCKGCCTGDGYQFIEEIDVCINLYTPFMTWFEANDTCTADNATLPIMYNVQFYNVTRDAIIDTVLTLPYSANVTVGCDPIADIWIGANDLEEEGKVKWLDGSYFSGLQTMETYIDNSSCDDETADCILASLETSKFNDRNCGLKLPFFCVKSDF